MGVVRRFTLGVVLAVDGNPFLGDHARTDPQPEAEKMRRNGMQVKRPMGLSPVQKNRDGRDGHVGGCQRVQHNLPPRKVPQTMA
ncbi:hypothetical protein D3C71_1861490 [compost metagenome]